MKYKYNGEWVDLSIKALDSMPVGTEVEFDGQASDIPVGWEIVEDIELINSRNYTSGWVSEGTIPSNTRFLYFVLNGEFTESVFIPLSVAKDYSGASPYFVSNKNGLIYQFYIETNNTLQGLFRSEAGTDYSVKIYAIK